MADLGGLGLGFLVRWTTVGIPNIKSHDLVERYSNAKIFSSESQLPPHLHIETLTSAFPQPHLEKLYQSQKVYRTRLSPLEVGYYRQGFPRLPQAKDTFSFKSVTDFSQVLRLRNVRYSGPGITLKRVLVCFTYVSLSSLGAKLMSKLRIRSARVPRRTKSASGLPMQLYVPMYLSDMYPSLCKVSVRCKGTEIRGKLRARETDLRAKLGG